MGSRAHGYQEAFIRSLFISSRSSDPNPIYSKRLAFVVPRPEVITV